ncbi:MAG TPA: cytidylate kinase-like family protein [Candidatus Binatia bacterium]|jgi:cytidylate kinase|nr:cytidylate kinase-like family protein [Candidatus Binatia bacterium]
MNTQIGLEKCLPFISSELQPGGTPPVFAREVPSRLAVTVSRQTGSGAHTVGEKLAEYLQAHAPKDAPPWQLFDRDLAEKVLEDHNLPRRLAQFMPEDRVSEMADALDELLGAHPPSWRLVQQTAETILQLAERGNVILIGRGANIVTSKLEHVFHVRLIGSLERRVERIQQLRGVGRKAALAFIRKEDRGRRRYLKKYFGQDLDDPRLYHLVINTDLVTFEKAARMIAEAALSGLHRRTPEAAPDRRVTRRAEAFL